MKRSKGFTLIELLAVIVILAIIALIATPLVLKYIAKSREGANDASANSVLRAAENYYAQSLLNTNISYPITLDLKNEEDIKKLSLKGSKPTEGIITIDKKGNIYLEAIYGEIIYVKLPNEEKITKNPMVIGDSATWITDGNGTITEYVDDLKNSPDGMAEIFYTYLDTIATYVQRLERNNSDYNFDYTKDLVENFELFERKIGFSYELLPIELKNELDYLIDICNTDKAMSDEELDNVLVANKDKAPYTLEFVGALESDSDVTKTQAYKIIEAQFSTVFTVPNYVKHEDGKLEKIITIASNSIASNTSFCPLSIRNKNLIISYGIENIGENNFHTCLLNNVIFASTVKTIGDNAFEYNKLSSLSLPNSLQTIGDNAFDYNNIKGELVIPNNVTFIGWGAFESIALTQDNCGTSYVCDIVGLKNEITNVVFEDGSKIEIIAANAFKDNLLTTLVIPGSIKEFGNFAFNMPTLASVTVNRLQGSDLSIGYDVFGSAKVEYIQ